MLKMIVIRLAAIVTIALSIGALNNPPALALQEESRSVQLPRPSGPYSVGVATWHWIDASRAQDSAVPAEGNREIMVQLWYPAQVSETEPTPYRPISQGRFKFVTQNSVAGAPFSDQVRSAPVIVLCPGRGTSMHYYSAIAEGLASRGFAVLAVDSPGVGYVEYPDGRIVNPDEAYQPSFELITGPYDRVDSFFEPAVKLGLEDIRFAVNQLRAIARSDPAGRLTGRLSFEKMGAFGHSLGGRICGAYAGTNNNVVAFASMEGVAPPAERRGGLKAASLMLYSSELPEEMALPNIREIFDYRRAPSAIIRLEGFGHNSVTDRPLLFPESFSYPIDPTTALSVFDALLGEFYEARFAGRSFPNPHVQLPRTVTIIEASEDQAEPSQAG